MCLNSIPLAHAQAIHSQGETTTAGYGQLRFSLEEKGLPVDGNVGLRYRVPTPEGVIELKVTTPGPITTTSASGAITTTPATSSGRLP